jgi:hypothetical protein
MAYTDAMFKTNLLFLISAQPPFKILANMADLRGNYKLNFKLCYLNNAAMLQYGGHAW